MPRLSLTTLIALLASLSACASPMDGAPRTAQEECVFGAGDVSPLRGPTGMVVAGSVNGEPATLEVSTGLGLTSVLPGSVQALGLPTDPVRRSGFGGRGPDDVRQNVRVRSLRVGGQDWTDRNVAVRPFFMHDGSPPAFDAMIGASLLRETELEVDLPARRVAFHPRRNCRPGAPPWAPASSVPMDMQNHGSPVIVARVNGHAVRALIHSGNNATVMTSRLADRLGLARADAAGLETAEGFDFPMTQEQVADATGLTAVHVNRTLKALDADGALLRKGNRFRVVDWQKLCVIADFDDAYLDAAA